MTPTINIDSVRCVYSDVNHNAWGDLIQFKGRFYVGFRSNPKGHLFNENSEAVIIVSDDGDNWEVALRYTDSNRILRDPHFAILGERLYAVSGSHNQVDDQFLSYCVSTSDGVNWSDLRPLEGTEGKFLWRVTAYDGKIYANEHRVLNPPPGGSDYDGDLASRSAIMVSDDGETYRDFVTFPQEGGNETGFEFEDDGTLLAVMRTIGLPPHNAVVWRAKPPYSEWTRTMLHRFIGGPMLAKWGKRYLVGGRRFEGEVASGTDGAHMSIGWLEGLGPGEMPHLVEGPDLPSGGDTSYPGFTALSDTEALVSYYSSHEGSRSKVAPASIYVARISINS
jgi:hypothetical protein